MLGTTGLACVVGVNENDHVVLDLRVFLLDVAGSALSVLKWKTKEVQSGLLQRSPTPALLDAVDPVMMPVDVTSTVESQIVSYGSSTFGEHPGDTVVALSRMQRAFDCGGSNASALRGVRPEVLDDLAAKGAITLHRPTPDGAVEGVSVNRSVLAWTGLYLLSDPVAVVLCGSQTTEPMKKSKVETMLQLRRAGWSVGNTGHEHTSDSERVMHGSLTRPLSYFVCLLNEEIIRNKGISRILHGGKDGYYRCLLQVPAEKLALLGDALHSPDTDNKWYLQQVVDHAGAEQAEPSVEDELQADVDEDGVALALLNAPADAVQFAPTVQGHTWKRFIARYGSSEIKVYFDKGVGSAAYSRTFAHCKEHDCRRYRPVMNYESREYLAAEMLCWSDAGELEECSIKRLGYAVPESDVRRLMPQITLVDF